MQNNRASLMLSLALKSVQEPEHDVTAVAKPVTKNIPPHIEHHVVPENDTGFENHVFGTENVTMKSNAVSENLVQVKVNENAKRSDTSFENIILGEKNDAEIEFDGNQLQNIVNIPEHGIEEMTVPKNIYGDQNCNEAYTVDCSDEEHNNIICIIVPNDCNAEEGILDTGGPSSPVFSLPLENLFLPINSVNILEETTSNCVSANCYENLSMGADLLMNSSSQVIRILNFDEDTSQKENVESSSKRKITPKDKISKKRLRQPSEWKSIKAKRELDLGIAHINRGGKLKPAKKMGSSCGSKCRYRCALNLSTEVRTQIFNDFWQIGSHTRQWDYISRFVKKIEKKQCTIPCDKESRRTCSMQYFLCGNEETRVCKTMFVNTLGITHNWVTTAMNKLDKHLGTISPDKRGRHHNRPNIIPADIKGSIRKHIAEFPQIESHYTRKDSKRKYLEADLNISKMHRLYLEWNIENKVVVKPATQRQYREIFDQEFNLSFFKPKKDQCDTCNSFKNLSPQEKLRKEETFNKHINNKNIVRKMKDEDKEKAVANNSSITVACFDLQKVLSTPQAEVSLFYYKRKLSTYNFTIYDFGRKEGHCYVWHERIAKRGSNEVSSCLFKFLKLQKENNVSDVTFYSDNCSGQNRNRIVFAFYLYAACVLKLKITHRFLEKGHTQNEGDSMHALIERAKKGKDIYIPEQWYTLIRMAKISGTPYAVTEMGQEHFFDFKVLLEKQNWSLAEDNNTVKWSRIREVSVCDSEPYKLFFKYNHTDDAMIIDLRKKVRGRPEQLACTDKILKVAYTSLLPIPKPKLDDLLSLCSSGNIPTIYHPFYQSLKSKNRKECVGDITTTEDEDSE